MMRKSLLSLEFSLLGNLVFFFHQQSSHIYFSLSLSLSPQQSRQNGFVASPTIFFFYCAARFKNPFSLPFSPPGTPVITEGKSSSFSFPFSSRSPPPSSLSQHWGRAEEGGERERGRERRAESEGKGGSRRRRRQRGKWRFESILWRGKEGGGTPDIIHKGGSFSWWLKARSLFCMLLKN